ncbi:MAG TPA: diadenylate cyclase CdaA [Anaerolineaceae bacterium]|nr:TIGR00159 family protein [Chloroflexota bacterium]HNY84036.1 diadenylate cyclase CdaA [Anaerolineaceae bacterium]
MQELINNLLFTFQRFTWASVLDIILVAAVFGLVLFLLRDTEAFTLLRGVFVLVVLIILLTTIVNLPAFSWLVRTLTPTLLLAVPVIFAPELRRALERVGRIGELGLLYRRRNSQESIKIEKAINAIARAAVQLSEHRHGALIVLKRFEYLDQYYKNGVWLDAELTPQLLMQIFYPNTPLHDGAVIVESDRIKAASCVMPLSSSGVLNSLPEHSVGLRHRAALGISEVSDVIAVVVSEETGTISIAHRGRLIRRLDRDRLINSMRAFMAIEETDQKAARAEQKVDNK